MPTTGALIRLLEKAKPSEVQMKSDLMLINGGSLHHRTYAKQTRWTEAQILPHSVRFSMFVVLSGAAITIAREPSFKE